MVGLFFQAGKDAVVGSGATDEYDGLVEGPNGVVAAWETDGQRGGTGQSMNEHLPMMHSLRYLTQPSAAAVTLKAVHRADLATPAPVH
jgi:hypothetical protein